MKRIWVDRAAAAARSIARPREQPRAATIGLTVLAAVAVGLRLIPIVLYPSLNWWDEIFQAIEPAHRLVYGYGLVAWEFQLGMRSWLLPGAVAGLMELARLAGDGPGCYLPAIAIGFGLLASAPVICCYLWSRRWFGTRAALLAAFAVALAPELVYFGARTLYEVAAAHLLVVACYLIEPGYKVTSRRRLVASGVLLGVVALMRIQIAPAVAVIALWSAKSDWRLRLPALIGGGAVAVAAIGAFDWLTLGYPLASVWRNVYDNIFLGVSSGFRVEPWFFYLAGEAGIWGSAAPLVLLLAVLGARRLPILALGAVAVIAVHSGIAHKEYRFIYPAIVLGMVLAAIGLAELESLGAQLLARRGVRQGAARAICVVLLAVGWGTVGFAVWSGKALLSLRQRDHDELLAMSFVRDLPAVCGIGLTGSNAWVRSGGYSYLHRPVPMFWADDETALAAESGAFDTLIDKGPAQPGFTTLRCFGDICVARRPGRCEERPMPAMWFPEQLRDIAPAPGQFEAIPERLRPAQQGR